MNRALAFTLASMAAVASANTDADDVNHIFPTGDHWKTGYVDIGRNSDIFYWGFESRSGNSSTDPLVLWLTGGPGCASEIALFYENGPYQFDENNNLDINPYSWNNNANLLFVDQPVGTGFSHAGLTEYTRNELDVAEDMATFFRGFLEQNPDFAGRDLYITGESYAGHYIPAISDYFLNNATDVDLTLKGLAIGNGLTDPFHQYPAYATFSYENDLITERWDHVMTAGMKACQGLIWESNNGPKQGIKAQVAALEFCQLLADSVIGNPLSPKFNVYDIRIPCEHPTLCYDFDPATVLMNESEVQQVLGVSGTWESCDNLVHTYLLGDWMTNLMPNVADILDNFPDVEVLVYSGDKDWICNWRGGEAWTLATKWGNQLDFNEQDYQTWQVEGEDAGALRKYGNFNFLRVYDAGHMVPMDQPRNALDMLTRFIANDWTL